MSARCVTSRASVKGIGLDKIQFVTVPNEPYEPDPNRVQWKESAEQIWSALRADRPVGAKATKPSASPSPTARRSPSPPPTSHVTRRQRHGGLGAGPSGRQRPRGAGLHRGHHRHHGHHHRTGRRRVLRPATPRTPAPSRRPSPGRSSRRPAASVAKVRVTLGRGAPDVVEVPNRLGSAPAALAEHLLRAEPHRVDPDPQRRHRHLLLSRVRGGADHPGGSGVVAVLTPGQHGEDHADVRPELGHVRGEERPGGVVGDFPVVQEHLG